MPKANHSDCPVCGRPYCARKTEADEALRLSRVARADAEWWSMQVGLLHSYPRLAEFAMEQAQRFAQVADAVDPHATNHLGPSTRDKS